MDGPRTEAGLVTPAHPEPLDDPWADLFTEVRSFEAWYAPTVMSVNAWIGVDTASDGYYGGFHVEGDRLYDDWDEEAVAASGETPEACIRELIRLGRAYRQRIEDRKAEDSAAVLALLPTTTEAPE